MLRLTQNVLRAALICVALNVAYFGAAWSQSVTSEFLEKIGLPSQRGGSAGEIERQQVALAWIGLYDGAINGQRTERFTKAVRTFQAGMGQRESGRLTNSQLRTLNQRADFLRSNARLTPTEVEWVGVKMLLPRGFVGQPKMWGDSHTHLVYDSAGPSGLSIEIQRYDRVITLNGVQSNVKKGSKVLASAQSGDAAALVVLDFKDKQPISRSYYVVFVSNGQTKILHIKIDASSVSTLRPLIGRLVENFEAFHQRAPSVAEIKRRVEAGVRPASRDLDWIKTVRGTGSGSIVSLQGHILSNHHVVEGCSRLTVFGRDAVLVGSDVRSDLALILVPDLAGRNPVRFERSPPNLGSSVFVLGYPVFSVSQSLNLTSGVVSSKVGLFGDRQHFQITAPVQSGNSGGPVLSSSGSQVGVVVAKPSAEFTQKRNLENIAWIIRGSVAQAFLQGFGVDPIMQSSGAQPIAENERSKNWRRFSVRVECHR